MDKRIMYLFACILLTSSSISFGMGESWVKKLFRIGVYGLLASSASPQPEGECLTSMPASDCNGNEGVSFDGDTLKISGSIAVFGENGLSSVPKSFFDQECLDSEQCMEEINNSLSEGHFALSEACGTEEGVCKKAHKKVYEHMNHQCDLLVCAKDAKPLQKATKKKRRNGW